MKTLLQVKQGVRVTAAGLPFILIAVCVWCLFSRSGGGFDAVQAAAAAPSAITLQVEWRTDGTFVNGKKVSDNWVAVMPPQQQQQQSEQTATVIPLPDEKTEPVKTEPAVTEPAVTEPAVTEPVVAESVVNPVIPAAAIAATDLIPLPLQKQEKTVKADPVKVVRRGLFGTRVTVVVRSPQDSSTARKQRDAKCSTQCSKQDCKKQDCSKQGGDVHGNSPSLLKRTVNRDGYRSAGRIGDGRILRFLFRSRI
jgi:hypothetical protein